MPSTKRAIRELPVMIPILTYDTKPSTSVDSRKDKALGTFSGLIATRIEVKSETLQANLSKFLSAMGGVLDKIPKALGGYEIRELEIEVEVSAEGEISLLGTGGKLGGKGSLTLKLERNAKGPTA
jgi:hypothetical protein